ncbi:MAG: S41 family peptidase [Thermomicrobiales bacterium]
MNRRIPDSRLSLSVGRISLQAVMGALAAMLVLASLRPDGLLASAAEPERLYVGNQASLSASIPARWGVDGTSSFDYVGEGGFILSGIVPQQTLIDACTSVAEGFHAERSPLPATWEGQDACTVDVDTSAGEGRVLVVPLPETITWVGTDVRFAFVMVDRAHFDRVVSTLSFGRSRVSPEAFVASVIDLVEARAWWSDGVDWKTQRPFLLQQAASLPDLESSGPLLQQLIGGLRIVGDNHSFLLSPVQVASFGQVDGFGMELAGEWVVAVYPDSPAARAGIRERDRIVAVDGKLSPNTYGVDPAMIWGPSVTLTIVREGEEAERSVPLVASTYTAYRPPEAAINGPLGYIALPGFSIMERAKDYARTGNDQIAIIDRAGVCGWIVDLRLDHGGSYSPMVSAVGSILGNGTFVGWLAPDGMKIWVSYEDGVIRSEGDEIANYLSPGERYQLATPMPPVAVLLGPGTTSSGEVTALAFIGRPDTKSFGTKTGGFTTANATTRLFDGSALRLAVAAMMDRSGQTFLTGIVPDEVVVGSADTFGTEDDPVIQAASQWLLSQEACAGATGTPEASPAARP